MPSFFEQMVMFVLYFALFVIFLIVLIGQDDIIEWLKKQQRVLRRIIARGIHAVWVRLTT